MYTPSGHCFLSRHDFAYNKIQLNKQWKPLHRHPNLWFKANKISFCMYYSQQVGNLRKKKLATLATRIKYRLSWDVAYDPFLDHNNLDIAL